MNDRDRRQLERILEQVAAYESGQLELSDLVSNLEGLLLSLEAMSKEWREAFRESWGVLEEVYSVAVVREEPLESSKNRALVSPALKEIGKQVGEALGR